MPSLSNYKTNNNSSRYNSKSKGKNNNSKSNRQIVFYNLEVKEYIIEEQPND